MRVPKISHTDLPEKDHGFKKVTSRVATKNTPTLEDTLILSKIKLTKATNSNYMRIIRSWFGV